MAAPIQPEQETWPGLVAALSPRAMREGETTWEHQESATTLCGHSPASQMPCPQPSHSRLSSPQRIHALRDAHTHIPHPPIQAFTVSPQTARRAQTCLCLLAFLSQDS